MKCGSSLGVLEFLLIKDSLSLLKVFLSNVKSFLGLIKLHLSFFQELFGLFDVRKSTSFFEESEI